MISTSIGIPKLKHFIGNRKKFQRRRNVVIVINTLVVACILLMYNRSRTLIQSQGNPLKEE